MKDLLTWETTEITEEETDEASDLLTQGTNELPTPAVPITTTADGRPDPKWVRGKCPECGDDLVSNLYYIGGKGYLIVWECWGSLNEDPRCTYRRVL
jgi:hypothetical protein